MTWLSASGLLRQPVPIPGAALFGRIVNARLRTFAANPLEKAHRQNDAWRVTHVTGIARRDAIFEALCPFRIFNERAL
jgi:hypothetical protein